jgi:antitoxin VapB
MAETGIAKLFMHGRSQAVRLPREFRLPGDRVRVRKVGDGVLLEPMPAPSWDEIFAQIDAIGADPLPPREQPPLPPDEDLFE